MKWRKTMKTKKKKRNLVLHLNELVRTTDCDWQPCLMECVSSPVPASSKDWAISTLVLHNLAAKEQKTAGFGVRKSCVSKNTHAFSKNRRWINYSAVQAKKFIRQNIPKVNDWSLAIKPGWTKRRSSEFSALAVCIASLLVALSQVGRVAVQLTTSCSCNITAHLKNNRDLLCPIRIITYWQIKVHIVQNDKFILKRIAVIY